MAGLASHRRAALLNIKVTEADAWAEYEDTIRNLVGNTYERVEPLAWFRLQATLGIVRREKKRLQ